MKLKFIFWFTAFWGILLYPSLSSASAFTQTEALNWANRKGKEIISILTSNDTPDKYASLDYILDNDVDLDYAAKFVVGKYWKQMTSEQQDRYLSLFRRYAKIVYRSYSLDIPKGEVYFTVDKAIITKPDTADTFCTIYINSVEKNVDEASKGGIKTIFTLHKQNNTIKVRNLKIEESSFLSAYRQRFYKMIHEDSEDEIDWFLEDFETIVTDNEAEN